MTLRDTLIRDFLTSTTRSGEMEEVVESGAVGEESVAFPDERRLILEKIASGDDLSSKEQFFAEAIIIPDRRPAIDIVDGTYEVRHENWVHLNEAALRKRMEGAFPAIGRVDIPWHPTVPHAGTAFVVGEDLLMTNRHVAEIFAQGIGTRALAFTEGRMAAMDFERERDSKTADLVDVTGIAMIHPYWDMALLRIEGLDPRHAALALSSKAVEEYEGHDVAVVGFPAFDRRNGAAVQDRVFGGVYDVKRLQPGRLNGRADVYTYGQTLSAPTHDSSTLGGNSGSCVIDVETGAVIALHFAGKYLERNWCVAASDLARDGRVVDAGVRFAPVPVSGYIPWAYSWRGRERADESDAPSSAPVPAPASVPVGDGVPGSDGETRITIPLEITVRLGEAGQGGAQGIAVSTPPASASGDTAQERPPPGRPHHDPDYTTRRGYDPDFLGLPVPLPIPRDPDALWTMPWGGLALPYHHFTLFMHRTRRLAALSAANVDASETAKAPGNRPRHDYSRGGLAGRKGDAWFFDDRIGRSMQLAERFFDRDRSAFDKGHLVRRDAVAWGATYDEMRHANGDSFHVTNCLPQVAGFNRATSGEDNWGDLEKLILREAQAERLQVFGGPVLAEDDPVFRGEDHEGEASIRIPRRYWKLVVARKDDALMALGFVLEQDLGGVDFEFTVPDRWVPHTVTVAEIEALSGFDFDASIRAADRHGQDEENLVAAPGQEAPDVEDILGIWREEQAVVPMRPGDPEATRFVVELGRPLTDASIEAVLEKAFGLSVHARPLFAADPDLDRFRVVEIPGVVEADRPDLFDIARAMRAHLDAVTVEPDLDSRYYDADPQSRPPKGTAEGMDFTAWCWADTEPKDPDWAVKAVGLPEAWARSEAAGRPARGQGIVIFQPDTGVVTTHPELPDPVWEDPRAANFIERGHPPIDPLRGGGSPGHGTGTGSVVASPLGGLVRGAAPEAELVPLRCIRSVIRFDQSTVAEAVDHARRNGAHVITMSLGGVPSRALRVAIERAVRENVIVVAAAGNCIGTVVWPARYGATIAVGGTNEAKEAWQGSSRGSAVDFSAPAEFVLRANPSDPDDPARVAGGQGTSFSAAMTAGMAACWLAHHGREALIAGLSYGETLQDLFRRMASASATPVEGLDPDEYGAGIIDADALLAADPVASGATEAVAGRGPSRLEDQVRELFASVAGPESVAAAEGATTSDPLATLEMACIGLDLARYRNRQHRTLESMPPPAVSRGLKAAIGPEALRSLTGRADR